MSTKSKFNFSGLKTALGRTKQIVTNKLGKTQNTQDIQFDEVNKELSHHVDIIKSTQRHIHAYMKTCREMTKQEQELIEMYSQIFETSSTVSQSFSQYSVFVSQMENFRTQLEDSLRTQIDEPIEDYLKQFDIMKKRVDERKRRLIDSDRYRTEYERTQQKGTEMEKVKMWQTKYINMKRAYEELNEELKNDIPKLLSDKSNFYSPLFAMLVYHQLEYYKGSHQASQSVYNSVQNINCQACHSHAQVITPEQESAHTMQINLDAPVSEMDEDEGDHNHNQPPPQQNNYNQPPPQQNNYNQPPPQQNYDQQSYNQPPPQQNYPPQNTPQKVPQKVPQKMGGPQKMGPKKMGGNQPPPQPKKLPPRSNQKQAKALYPFQGQDQSELSFNVGDVLIIHNQNGEWWEAELNQQRGLIPANYVSLL
eukprot:TRINITY_DN144_c0_g1_i2.p1 TRINITY_DN144_c0_g1~~TRINITY_DN144_c0_g1_i2.p1  ORF type:complete len:421 (-),score=144.30 TRINITY_DN144_c0_g1_i2:69-1331(-)